MQPALLGVELHVQFLSFFFVFFICMQDAILIK